MSFTAQQLADLMPDARQLLSDEPEMESSLHYQQLALLMNCLEWHWRERQDFFIGANLTVYYDHEQLRRRNFRGPDFFLVRGVARHPRNSWVVWEEGGRYPDLIIELLSDSTARVDRTEKKILYQNVFRTPEYFWFSPITLEFVGFRLIEGQYKAIPTDDKGRRWCKSLGMNLGVEQGSLRYFDTQGNKLPSSAEAAEQAEDRAKQAEDRAKQAEDRAKQAEDRAEQLLARLQALSIDVEDAH